MPFVLSEGNPAGVSLSEFVIVVLALGSWLALGALAVFAPPYSLKRRGAATVVAVAWLGGVSWVGHTGWLGLESVDSAPEAVLRSLVVVWLLAPGVLAYGAWRGLR